MSEDNENVRRRFKRGDEGGEGEPDVEAQRFKRSDEEQPEGEQQRFKRSDVGSDDEPDVEAHAFRFR